jgi:hypothetical protein
MVSRRWSWFAGFALLFAGITNAHSHVHYCFDGQEPPAAVHISDGADHHHETLGHHDDGTKHDDLDVDVQTQALAKVVKYDLPAIPVLTWSMTFDAMPGDTLEARIDTPPHPNPRYTLPQLRAPPR